MSKREEATLIEINFSVEYMKLSNLWLACRKEQLKSNYKSWRG